MCAGMSFCAMGDAGGIGMERTRRREGEIVFVNLIRCFLDNVLRGWRGLLPVFVRGDVKVCLKFIPAICTPHFAVYYSNMRGTENESYHFQRLCGLLSVIGGRLTITFLLFPYR